MKFKVGDKVRIREDLKEGYDFKSYVNDGMKKLAGRIVTITRAWGKCGAKYEIDADGGLCTWTEDMFATKPTKKRIICNATRNNYKNRQRRTQYFYKSRRK